MIPRAVTSSLDTSRQISHLLAEICWNGFRQNQLPLLLFAFSCFCSGSEHQHLRRSHPYRAPPPARSRCRAPSALPLSPEVATPPLVATSPPTPWCCRSALSGYALSGSALRPSLFTALAARRCAAPAREPWRGQALAAQPGRRRARALRHPPPCWRPQSSPTPPPSQLPTDDARRHPHRRCHAMVAVACA